MTNVDLITNDNERQFIDPMYVDNKVSNELKPDNVYVSGCNSKTYPILCASDRSNVTESASTHDSTCHLILGSASILGLRPENQDALTSIPHFFENNDCNLHYFALFDGHLGRTCADFSALNLPIYIKTKLESGSSIKEALSRSFVQLDEEYERLYLNNQDGTTVLVIIIDTMNKKVYTAHAGDSRAALSFTSSNKNRIPSNKKNDIQIHSVKRLTEDHKPNRFDEKQRVENAGAKVIHVGCYRVSIPRVRIRLAISRAIGDFSMKRYNREAIIPNAEINEYSLYHSHNFSIVLGTDGLWDVFNENTVMNTVNDVFSCVLEAPIVSSHNRKYGEGKNHFGSISDVDKSIQNGVFYSTTANAAITNLCQSAVYNGSSDNVTAICIWGVWS